MQMIWSTALGDACPPLPAPSLPHLLHLPVSIVPPLRLRRNAFLLCRLPLSRKSFISLVVGPFAILRLCLLPHSALLLSSPICEPGLSADLISLFYIMADRDMCCFYISM